MDRKSILIVDFFGAPQILLAVIRTLASSRGVVIHLMSDNPKEPARLSRYISSFRYVPQSLGDNELLRRVLAEVSEHHIDVLLPSDEESVRFLSQNRTILESHCAVSPVPPPGPLAVCRDKWLLGQELQARGIPSPRTVLLHESIEWESIPEDFPFPALVKDRIGCGGHGIQLIRRREDLPEILKTHPAPSESRILQEFIPGYDIDCSLLCEGGKVLAWTVQRGILAGSAPYGAPAGIRFCDNPGAMATASAWAARSQWSGVAHLDMRFDERTGQYPIIEVNPRYWRSLLGSFVAGVNFPLCACRTALGESFAFPRQTEAKFIHESRTSLQQLLASYTGREPERFAWSQTNLSFAIRDPLPDIALYLLY